MSGIVLYLAGGSLLASCLLWILFDRRTEDEFSNPLRRTEEPPADTLSDSRFSAQLFGSEDWRYLTSFGSRTIEREFLRTRKTVALAWVRAARAEARALMSAHRAAARTSTHLNFLVEFRIALAYAAFLFFCMLLNLIIRIRGPVALQALAKLADSQSNRLYEIVGQVFPIGETFKDEFGGVLPARRGRG